LIRTYTSHGISIRVDRSRFAHLSDTQFDDLLDLYCAVEAQQMKRDTAARNRWIADHMRGFAELNDGRLPSDAELLRSVAVSNPPAYAWRELPPPR
jgi:hypothetical protein